MTMSDAMDECELELSKRLMVAAVYFVDYTQQCQKEEWSADANIDSRETWIERRYHGWSVDGVDQCRCRSSDGTYGVSMIVSV